MAGTDSGSSAGLLAAKVYEVFASNGKNPGNATEAVDLATKFLVRGSLGVAAGEWRGSTAAGGTPVLQAIFSGTEPRLVTVWNDGPDPVTVSAYSNGARFVKESVETSTCLVVDASQVKVESKDGTSAHGRFMVR